MNRAELAELLHNGENSGVELKRDDIRPEKLAKEMAALLNLDTSGTFAGLSVPGRPAPGRLLTRPHQHGESGVHHGESDCDRGLHRARRTRPRLGGGRRIAIDSPR